MTNSDVPKPSASSDQESSEDIISLEGVAELHQAKADQEAKQARRRALAQRVRDCEMRLELAGSEQFRICQQELMLAQSELAVFDLTPEVERGVGPELGPDLDWGR
jgi:hypothetical protein